MAQVVNSTNHLEQDLNHLTKSNKKDVAIGFGLFLTGLFSHFIIPFLLPIICWFFAGKRMFKAIKQAQQYTILKSGLEGEKASLAIFKSLPNDYYIVSDVKIEVEGKQSQLDHIVVGPNGIFVIETKNLNGEIKGDYLSTNITQHKVGRKGGAYSRTLYNPIKQVNTHVYRLATLLKQHRFHYWVQGIVYFSNREAEVYIKTDSTPVFSLSAAGDVAIKQYIENFTKQQISDYDQIKIVKLLSNCVIG